MSAMTEVIVPGSFFGDWASLTTPKAADNVLGRL